MAEGSLFWIFWKKQVVNQSVIYLKHYAKKQKYYFRSEIKIAWFFSDKENLWARHDFYIAIMIAQEGISQDFLDKNS